MVCGNSIHRGLRPALPQLRLFPGDNGAAKGVQRAGVKVHPALQADAESLRVDNDVKGAQGGGVSVLVQGGGPAPGAPALPGQPGPRL